MGIPVIDTGPMTVEDFYAFTDGRPDGEKWELIDGEAILNATPAFLHQRILTNLLVALTLELRAHGDRWVAIPGIGVRVSDTSRPEPDAMIVPPIGAGLDARARDTREAVVLFEILSPSTLNRDLKWKRTAYTSMPALTHYVVIAQDLVEVVVFARDNGFAEQRLTSREATLELNSIDVSLPLAEIYRDTDFG